MRTIQSPGVEIFERDLSQYTPAIAGTAALVMGYAVKGEDELPSQFTSRNAWLNYFGVPEDEAERYFYHASMEILNQNGTLYTAKLPYSNSVSGIYLKSDFTVGSSTSVVSNSSLSAALEEFENLTTYNDITVSSIDSVVTSALDGYRTSSQKPSANEFSIIDVSRARLGKDVDDAEVVGYFPVITTAINALAIQDMIDSTYTSTMTQWNSVSSITTSAGSTVTSGNMAIQLASSSKSTETISTQTASLFPSVVYGETDGYLETKYLNQIMVSVVKMYVDSSNNNKINYSIVENFIGSLNQSATDPETNESTYIGNVINSNSQYIEFYGDVVANLATTNATYHVSNLDAGIFGFTEAQMAKTIQLSTMLTSMDNVFDQLSNIIETEIDIVVDGGLTNIAQYLESTSNTEYDPTSGVSTWTLASRDDTAEWRSVAAKMITFAQNTRKDCVVLLDGPRQLCVEGNQKIVRSSNSATIDANIITKLKYITGINSSYAAGYLNWYRQLDDFTGLNFWCPPSVKSAGACIFTDRTANYWDAPAGLTRGIVYNANDIAFNPNGKQQGSIYTKGWNYAVNYPLDGIVIEGQKTLQTKPSAFDRLNVRRMFLRLERLVYNIARYYVYEPNTYYTRTRFVDQITPIFEDVKIRGGLYDYRIICSEKNNSTEVIDRNELKVAIMLKPTKTAEFVIIEFTSLRTGGSFDEVIL